MPAIPSIDLGALLRLAALTVAASVIVAFLENTLRFLVWAVFNIVATMASFLARALLTFVAFLTRLIEEAIAGLAQEGVIGQSTNRPWIGWYLIGPWLYFLLFLIFLTSDFTVAILVFQAMGLVLGEVSLGQSPIPLELAAALLFVAFAVFWGILLFDLLGVTPFAYLWSKLDSTTRKRLLWLAGAAFFTTVVTAFLMGLWSQWQISPDPNHPIDKPEPWNSVIPPLVRALLVVLVVSATYFSGKPLGSVAGALWTVVLLVLRVLSIVSMTVLRGMVYLLRALIELPFAALGILAYFGNRLWNWICSFGLAKYLHISPLNRSPLAELGGDINSPLEWSRRQTTDVTPNGGSGLPSESLGRIVPQPTPRDDGI